MTKEATQQGVSKTPEQIKSDNEAAVAEVRNDTNKEQLGEREELAQRHREKRDAELADAGHAVEDTATDNDSDNVSFESGNDGKDDNDSQKSNDSHVDTSEKFVTLTIDGKETKVPESKILDAGTRAMQKDIAADTRLEEATQILNDAKATAEQLTKSDSQPSTQDVDDTASKSVDNEALAKTLIDGDVDEVAKAIGDIMGTGRQDELATQAVKMQPNDVYGMVEGALQMKEAMETFEKPPEDGGYGDLYSDEVTRQMVFDKEAELAKDAANGSPKERLAKAANEVREWRNGVVEKSGGQVVNFDEKKAKKTTASSTPNTSGGRVTEETNEQPESEADKRRKVLAKMSRLRGQHLD